MGRELLARRPWGSFTLGKGAELRECVSKGVDNWDCCRVYDSVGAFVRLEPFFPRSRHSASARVATKPRAKIRLAFCCLVEVGLWDGAGFVWWSNPDPLGGQTGHINTIDH